MWVRLRAEDTRSIVYFVGMLIMGMALAMVIPVATAIVAAEWAVAVYYVFGLGLALFVGGSLTLAKPRTAKLDHAEALIVTALAWLAASLVAAVPLAFAQSYPTYFDAVFDAMSGLTTSGLTVATDLDHMALADNMWRHLTHLIGGQGIVVAALSFAVGLRGGGGISLYLAEGRDERILPNVMFTVRFIWFVALVFIGFGAAALAGVALWLGMTPMRAALHGFWIAVAAYDTGGFAPQSLNMMYYRSAVFEWVAVLLMLAGTLNFNLHAQVWRGMRSEMHRNIETRLLAANMVVITVVATVSAVGVGWLVGPRALVSKVAFHVISANSGTGHQTIYPAQWASTLGGGAMAAIVLAMAFGGAVSSTAGGIKSLRIGLVLKSVTLQVKRSLAPGSAVIRVKYHHLKERILTSDAAGAAATLFIIYAVVYISGGLIGAALGYPVGDALFESTSATANVGLSTGITSADMNPLLKGLYILQMWAGRLEFVAVMSLMAHIVLAVIPRARKRAA